jgi:hypothetical protein
MPLLFRYFWFLLAAAMMVNIVVWQRRLRGVVERGVATKAEVARAVRWAAVWLVGGPVLLGLISLAAGWSSPFCSGMLSFANIPSSFVAIFTLSSWAAALWWVWRGNGADFLSRVGPALGQRPSYDRTYPLGLVRAAVTLMVMASAIGATIASNTLPVSPELACPALSTVH